MSKTMIMVIIGVLVLGLVIFMFMKNKPAVQAGIGGGGPAGGPAIPPVFTGPPADVALTSGQKAAAKSEAMAKCLKLNLIPIIGQARYLACRKTVNADPVYK